MPEFQDINAAFDSTLRLPLDGKVYAIESPSAEDGLTITALVSGVLDGHLADVLEGNAEANLYRLCLGAAYDELVADNVSWAKLQHVAQTALTWITAGDEMAAAVWAAPSAPGSPGKAPKAPQDRKPRTRR